jgi:hypothetical protein
MPNKPKSKTIKKTDASTASKPKKKASKYEEIFKVEGTFEGIMKKLVTPKK